MNIHHARLAILSTVLSLTVAATAQSSSPKPGTAPKPRAQMHVVAGIVASDGTVHYLPRVNVKVMPAEFGKIESKITADFNSQAAVEQTHRDELLRAVVDGRRGELAKAAEKYHSELSEKLATFHPTATSLLPTCIAYNKYLDKDRGACDDALASVREKLYLSAPLRDFLVSEAAIGKFDAATFSVASTPLASGQVWNVVRIEQLKAIPEFAKEAEKALGKESKGLKLAAGQAIPDSVSTAAVARFMQEWHKAAGSRSIYSIQPRGGLTKFNALHPDDLTFALNGINTALVKQRKQLTDEVLSRYIKEKDAINARYDAQQATIDEHFRAALDKLEKDRTSAVETASGKSKPAAIGQTSLQGDFSPTIPVGNYAVYAEDTTTDRRFRWMLPVRVVSGMGTVELTDANALKTSAISYPSAASEVRYPKAAELSADERSEYELRYGHRLLKSWTIAAAANSVIPEAETFAVEDTPLGFGFHVTGRSTVVFNTLRMSDNDVAARFFKEAVSSFVKLTPNDLKSTGGTRAFEAVTVSVVGSTKSFAEEYAVGDFFTLAYTFKVSDIESFTSEKINAQQLADRAHIRDSRTGRISVQLTSAH